MGQFGQGNAAGGHAGSVEAILRFAASTMNIPPLPCALARRQPAAMSSGTRPGRRSRISTVGETDADARQARLAINVVRLPELLGKANRD
jgi:hypothetical protein